MKLCQCVWVYCTLKKVLLACELSFWTKYSVLVMFWKLKIILLQLFYMYLELYKKWCYCMKQQWTNSVKYNYYYYIVIAVLLYSIIMSFPGGSDRKESACDVRDLVWSLGWENPLEEEMATHSSILGWRIPMGRGAWWATIHGVAKSWTQVRD